MPDTEELPARRHMGDGKKNAASERIWTAIRSSPSCASSTRGSSTSPCPIDLLDLLRKLDEVERKR